MNDDLSDEKVRHGSKDMMVCNGRGYLDVTGLSEEDIKELSDRIEQRQADRRTKDKYIELGKALGWEFLPSDHPPVPGVDRPLVFFRNPLSDAEVGICKSFVDAVIECFGCRRRPLQ